MSRKKRLMVLVVALAPVAIVLATTVVPTVKPAHDEPDLAGNLPTILALAAVFAPVLVAGLQGRGAGVWKFLAFVCCALAGIGVITIIGIPFAVFWWLLAWVFAGVAVSSIGKERKADKRQAAQQTAIDGLRDELRELRRLQAENDRATRAATIAEAAHAAIADAANRR